MRRTFHLRTFAIVLLVVLAACSPVAAPLPTEPQHPTAVLVIATSAPAAEPAPTNTSAPIPAPTATPTAQDLAADLDAFLQKVTKSRVFSGAVLVAREGQIILSQGYGLADREKNLPNTPQTRYRIYSVTKQFTAMAILMLQEQGRLSVQDLICQYIPDCPVAWKEITIHHLLTHTSGIPDYLGFPDYPETAATPSPRVQIIARFKDKALDFAPGEQWAYSNSGYVLLGAIIEKVSGQSYAEYLRTNIFEPLKMVNTGFDDNRSDLAVGYTDHTKTKANFVDMSIADAAGGLYSTVEDLYRWDQALYTEQLVPQQALDTMFTAHVSTPFHGLDYGYGWFIGQWFNRHRISHTGSLVGYTSLIDRYPADKVTVIILTNQENVDPTTLSDILEKRIFGEQ